VWHARRRVLGGVLVIGAITAPIHGSATAAGEGELVLRSGTLVAFRGTSLQCLAFGPLARVEGERGVLCFKGHPRQHAAGTRWIWTTSKSISSAANSTDAEYRAIRSGTTIRRTVTVAPGTTFRLAGTGHVWRGRPAELGCGFERAAGEPAGQARVICVTLGETGPLPRSYGFLVSQRLVASITFAADGRRFTVDTQWRQPPCSCDR
jgi:hypothetical protein